MSNFIHLAEACQNTFLLVDCLNIKKPDQKLLDHVHSCLVQAARDDALILVNGQEDEGSFIVEMLVFGADQQFGDFCGNGSRACAAYLYSNYPQYSTFYIKAKGEKRLLRHYGQHDYSIDLPAVSFMPDKKFIAEKAFFDILDGYSQLRFDGKTLYYADIMEPHLILNASLSLIDTERLGIKLNQQRALFPQGINLTVYNENTTNNTLETVTYERGVQRLTKSCGTGACCAAAFFLKGKPGRVRVKNPGGILKIANQRNGIQLLGQGLVTGVLVQ